MIGNLARKPNRPIEGSCPFWGPLDPSEIVIGAEVPLDSTVR
ncbi:MAG: hypothetical protein O9276_03110 [Microcystis sp. LE17-20A]|jgi:hypothetical protein|nr:MULTISPECIES: hypothetical protein [Microcystis]MCZ8037134.1 hypothetical protein [Microcystis sp. LE17-20A]MCZ8212517.1 hypothetical protein [Microcystis sp. LE19-8.1F]